MKQALVFVLMLAGSCWSYALSNLDSGLVTTGVGTYSGLVHGAANIALPFQLMFDLVSRVGLKLAALFLADADSAIQSANGVPEPVTLLLCGITLVAMGILRRLPDEML